VAEAIQIQAVCMGPLGPLFYSLKHDPEKWEPVFRKDHAQTRR
jgi:hypothetical protein